MREIWGRIMYTLTQGRDAWNRYNVTTTVDKLQQLYSERWAMYTGTIFNSAWKKSPHRHSAELYNGIMLLLKHVESVVDFYATIVYQGDLSTDGKSLPDGTLGAIPWDPQVPTKTDEDALRLALSELTNAWNWKENMTSRPTMGAALGDVLTELVDDPDRGFVWPAMVWPGYVTVIELDYVGNVRYYKLEYPVAEWNEQTKSYEHYTFKKEVTPDEFRYYKGDTPFDYYGPGTAVEVNPYGFVPAIWDRHTTGWDERGVPATEGTRQSLLQVNSLLSQSFDFQRRVFVTPIFIKGLRNRRNQERVQLGRNPTEYIDDEGNVYSPAEELGIVPIAGENPQILQPQFDLGQTLSIVERIVDGILDENPEARFYKELRAMSTLTGPGVERALGDAVSRGNRARARYDTQTIKLFQMAITMCGIRANDGSWGNLSRRQQAFKPYTIDSYKQGVLDLGILSRPIVPMTEKERLEIIQMKETITTEWGWNEAGFTEDEIRRFKEDKAASNRTFGVGLNTGAIRP